MSQELLEPLDPALLQQRVAGLMKLLEITRQLSAKHELDDVLESVTSSVCQALSCERASLYLYDDLRRELYTRVVTELEIEEIRSSIDSGITGWVARRRAIANIPNPHADARWNSAIDRQTGFRTRNILAAPMISVHDDRLVGVLQLLNKEEGPFDAFDEDLLQAFAAHAASAVERAQFLEESRRAHELKISIEVGRSIQAGFLPDRLPEIPGYEVAAWWEPAEAVGGDYYDLLRLPDGRLGLVVADVSGHGVGPSLIMASARAMLHVLSRTRSEPEQILSLLSESVSPDLTEGRFITFLIVALDPLRHELTFANAGHGPALHFHRATGRFEALESTGLPIGICDDFAIPRGRTVQLDPGDLLVLATDGAIEVRNERDEMFGRERLQQTIAEHQHLPADRILEVIRRQINEFHPRAHPPDDVTILILERKTYTVPGR